jgi:hypothetical protein
MELAMNDTPPLAEWLHWVAAMPPALRALPEEFDGGTVRTQAVVCDLFETLFGSPADPVIVSACRPNDTGKRELNRMRWILAACHVLWHPHLRAAAGEKAEIERFIVQELAGLAAVASIDLLFREEERKEELVRRVLRASKCRLPGEGDKEAEDRLGQLDSVERHRVLAAAVTRERRAREVREAMARKAVEEAAAKVSRE